jgi:hypothetical protein
MIRYLLPSKVYTKLSSRVSNMVYNEIEYLITYIMESDRVSITIHPSSNKVYNKLSSNRVSTSIHPSSNRMYNKISNRDRVYDKLSNRGI